MEMDTMVCDFRGVPFRIACTHAVPQDPTWFTFADEAEVRDRDWEVRDGDFVMDVGAAFGSYAMTALSQGAAKVWAWSPQEYAGVTEKEWLEASLRLNGWETRCEVLTTGFHDEEGWFDTRNQDLMMAEPPADKAIIRVERMDTWYEREAPPRVDWLKLDVEGAEVDVLRGGLRLIRERRPVILVENHLFVRDTIAQEVEELLVAEGYERIRTVPHHGVSHSVYRPCAVE